jgi:orotidine-5'-phosphate decarboxylase
MARRALSGRFGERLAARMRERDSLVCVGLDPDLERLPAPLRGIDDREEAIVRFVGGIVEATADLACAFKPNFGFFVAHGAAGMRALERVKGLIPADVPVLLDAKIGDIDSTAAAYARGVFDEWGFDAVTLNPYLGEDALAPFIDRDDRGAFILCKTSNPGSGDLQDLTLADGGPLSRRVAATVERWAERHPATLGLVVGATWPGDLAAVRAICPERPILLPGVGAQAGDLEDAVRAGIDGGGAGLLVSSSRAILYAGDGADWADRARAEALRLREAVNAVRGVRA